MDKKMKIGLDIHGVTDTHPFFKEMARVMIAAGHEIHIITGATMRKAVRDLEKLGMQKMIHYTTICSITDYLIDRGIPVEWKDPSNPVFPDSEWNGVKAAYCLEYDIDIHFDDSDVYNRHFITPYARILPHHTT